MEEPAPNTIEQLADQLLRWFDLSDRYAVAFSGGVDSAVVAVAAHYSGVKTCLITACGPSLSQRDREDAIRVVQTFGLQHHWLETSESVDPAYQRNDLRRCFYCKSHLYSAIRREFPDTIILSGTNRDDLQDYRPGLEAAELAAVRAPLAELNLGKQQVRQLAHYWNVPVAAKPASPCLASRLAYGVAVTPERLEMVETAERYVRYLLQVDDCRVRLHADGLGRIELNDETIEQALTAPKRLSILSELQRLGFRYVTIDLANQRSGSLNPVQAKLVTISRPSR